MNLFRSAWVYWETECQIHSRPTSTSTEKYISPLLAQSSLKRVMETCSQKKPAMVAMETIQKITSRMLLTAGFLAGR